MERVEATKCSYINIQYICIFILEKLNTYLNNANLLNKIKILNGTTSIDKDYQMKWLSGTQSKIEGKLKK